MFSLRVQGRFPVGATTFVTPVRPARAIGSAKLRNGSAALYLEEVAYTAYYPADITSKPAKRGLDWVIRPLKESLHGFSIFASLPIWALWPVVFLFGVLIKIPVYPNAPLLSPPIVEQESKTELDQWPLVLFSHGLGGSRTAYSQFCSRLAASGKVVLAIEHRDGTGPACMVRSWNVNGKSKPRPVLYLKENDVVWEQSNTVNSDTSLPLRTDQLAFRHEEVYIAYTTFCQLVQNDPTLELETVDGRDIDLQSWSCINELSGRRPISSDKNVNLAGHSFGGCTVLSILSTRPPQGYSPINISKVVILDPWLEPLPSPGPEPLQDFASIADSVESSINETKQDDSSKAATSLPRMLVMNSETFTLWKDHFARLQSVVDLWEPEGKRLITLVGSQHASFSDFPVLPVIRSQAAEKLMEIITTMSIAFLDGRIKQSLDEASVRKMEINIIGKKKDGRPKRKLVGNVGDIIVH